MIWRPFKGQRVQVWYGEGLRKVCVGHGKCGVVEAVGIGPGPVNVAVRLDNGERVGVSRGNLRPVRVDEG